MVLSRDRGTACRRTGSARVSGAPRFTVSLWIFVAMVSEEREAVVFVMDRTNRLGVDGRHYVIGW